MIHTQRLGDELYVFHNGKLIFKRWVKLGYSLTFHGAFIALLIVGCDALVPPIPQPPPVPPIVIVDPVVPTGDVEWVVVLEETADRTPQTATLLADPWWQTNGLKYRHYDVDSPDAENVVRAVGKTTLPAIVLVGGDKKLIYVGTLPRSIAALKDLIKGTK